MDFGCFHRMDVMCPDRLDICGRLNDRKFWYWKETNAIICNTSFFFFFFSSSCKKKKEKKKRYKWQMSHVYHEKTRYSEYSKPPPPKKKGGMKKGQGRRSIRRSSNGYYYQTNTKTLNPLSKRF